MGDRGIITLPGLPEARGLRAADDSHGGEPQDSNANLLRNMAALWRADPDLAVRVDALDEDDLPKLEPARKRGFTLRAASSDGASLYLHSRVDPIEEAARFAEEALKDPRYGWVLCGLGLGYPAAALVERAVGDMFIVVVEPSVERIALALRCVDLSEALCKGRILFMPDVSKAALHDKLHDKATLLLLGMRILQHGPSVRLKPEFYREMSRTFTEFVTYQRMSLMTLVANSKITCQNIAMNFGAFVSTPSIDLLQGAAKGHPAIIVSAGPSLKRNVHQLAGVGDRAVVISVQTTLQPLLECGLHPHFVTSLDFHEMSRRFFDGLPRPLDVHLVAEPKATWHAVDEYPGPKWLLGNRWAELVLGPELGRKGCLPAGATVAHLAFYLARHLGCDPIIFIGQDLAYTGHAFYTPGVEVHDTWRGEINRFNTLEHKEWERIARNGPILRRVPGIDGRPIFTDELLLTYLEQFERDIAATSACVINATEGGAAIRGSEAMTLAEAVARHCTRPLPDAFHAALRHANCTASPRCDLLLPSRDREGAVLQEGGSIAPSARRDAHETCEEKEPLPYGRGSEGKAVARRSDAASSALARAGKILKDRMNELKEVEDVCAELLTLFDELEKLTDRPDAFNRRLVRVDELRTRVHRATRPYEIVNLATQWVELQRYSADRKMDLEEPTGVERAKRQLARDRAFIKGLLDGALEVVRILKNARERLEREGVNRSV